MRRLALVPFLIALVLPGQVWGIGLGSLEMHSALHQPVDAEIPLHGVAAGDIDRISVALASERAFRNVGLARPGFLTQLRFEVRERDPGELYIAITTREAISEPYLNFLLEVDAPSGNLVREYTALLDPPIYASEEAEPETAQPAVAEAEPEPEPAPTPEPEVAPEPEPEAVARRQAFGDEPVFLRVEREREAVHEQRRLAEIRAAEEAEREAAERAAREAEARRLAERPTTHTTSAGDTAWEIASRHAEGETSIQQMMLALLRHNPEAFQEGNINRLRQGYVLRIPDQDEARSLEAQEAIARVRQQNELWQAWRESLRDVAAAPAPDDDEVREPMEPGVEDELRIVGADEGAEVAADDDATGVADQAELRATREQLEATRMEKEELEARVGELESTVERMEQLITLRNEQLDELQTQLGAAQETAPDVAEEADDDDDWLAAMLAMLAGITGAVSGLAAGGLGGVGGLPMMALGAVAALLLLALLYRRRQQAAAAEDEELAGDIDATVALGDPDADIDEPVTDESDTPADEMADAEAAGAEDETRIAEPHPAPADDSAEDASAAADEADAGGDAAEQDETIAEADVYLAYGLLDQAEELLRNALKEHPQRSEYQEKMLETLYSARKRDAFETQAETFRQTIDDDSDPLWRRVLAMGREIAPDNPLFASADADEEALRPERPERPPATDIELDPEEGEAASAPAQDVDLDLGGDPGTGDDRGTGDDNLMEFDLGDLDDFAGEDELRPATDEPEEERPATGEQPAGEPELEAGGLDLDLGGEAEPAAGTESEPDLEAGGLDLDLDDEGAPTAEEEDEDDKDKGVAAATDDPGLEFDLGDLEAETPADERRPDADADAGELPAMDDSAGEAADTADEEALGAGDELQDFEFDLGDLEEFEPQENETRASAAADADGDEAGDEEVEAEDYDTMLDLARAYIEMGDMESARSTLDEILASGDERQQQEARELLESTD